MTTANYPSHTDEIHFGAAPLRVSTDTEAAAAIHGNYANRGGPPANTSAPAAPVPSSSLPSMPSVAMRRMPYSTNSPKPAFKNARVSSAATSRKRKMAATVAIRRSDEQPQQQQRAASQDNAGGNYRAQNMLSLGFAANLSSKQSHLQNTKKPRCSSSASTSSSAFNHSANGMGAFASDCVGDDHDDDHDPLAPYQSEAFMGVDNSNSSTSCRYHDENRADNDEAGSRRHGSGAMASPTTSEGATKATSSRSNRTSESSSSLGRTMAICHKEGGGRDPINPAFRGQPSQSIDVVGMRGSHQEEQNQTATTKTTNLERVERSRVTMHGSSVSHDLFSSQYRSPSSRPGQQEGGRSGSVEERQQQPQNPSLSEQRQEGGRNSLMESERHQDSSRQDVYSGGGVIFIGAAGGVRSHDYLTRLSPVSPAIDGTALLAQQDGKQGRSSLIVLQHPQVFAPDRVSVHPDEELLKRHRPVVSLSDLLTDYNLRNAAGNNFPESAAPLPAGGMMILPPSVRQPQTAPFCAAGRAAQPSTSTTAGRAATSAAVAAGGSSIVSAQDANSALSVLTMAELAEAKLILEQQNQQQEVLQLQQQLQYDLISRLSSLAGILAASSNSGGGNANLSRPQEAPPPPPPPPPPPLAQPESGLILNDPRRHLLAASDGGETLSPTAHHHHLASSLSSSILLPTRGSTPQLSFPSSTLVVNEVPPRLVQMSTHPATGGLTPALYLPNQDAATNSRANIRGDPSSEITTNCKVTDHSSSTAREGKEVANYEVETTGNDEEGSPCDLVETSEKDKACPTNGVVKFSAEEEKRTSVPHWSERSCIPLATSEDDNWLSEFFCFVRSKLVEVFEAHYCEVRERIHSKKVVFQQAGIRCRYCAHLPHRQRAVRSSCYPSSLKRIYQSLTMMIREHFVRCSEIPANMKNRFLDLKAQATQGANDSKRYWIKSAKELGLVETPHHGLAFRSVIEEERDNTQ